MANTIPVSFRRSGENLVNYSWTDVSTGLNYIAFYLAKTETNGGEDYILTTNGSLYSSEEFEQVSNTTKDMDFDITLVRPLTIEGTAFLSAALWCHADDDLYITAQLMKYDGSETNLSAQITGPTRDGMEEVMDLIPIPITATTTLGVGDVLRLNVRFIEAGANNAKLGTDPAGRTHTELTITTTSVLWLPVRSLK